MPFCFWQTIFNVVFKFCTQIGKPPTSSPRSPYGLCFSWKGSWGAGAITIARCVCCFRMAKTTLFSRYQRLWAWKRILDSLCLPHLFPVWRKRKCVTPNSIMTTQQESGTVYGQHPPGGRDGGTSRSFGEGMEGRLPLTSIFNLSPETAIRGSAPWRGPG